MTEDETLVLVVEDGDEDEEPVMEEDELVPDIDDCDDDEDCVFLIDVVLVEDPPESETVEELELDD